MLTDYSTRYSSALTTLKQIWGYDSFREGQDEVVSQVLKGRDTLVLFPTGGGKSLCFQIPALVMDGLTLVVSPLVALMEDQVYQLQRRGVAAEFINSTLTRYEVEQRILNARNGMYRLLYVAPERLQTPLFQYELASMNIEMVAIDEAHCISEWGHEFRPSYRQIRPCIESAGITPRWLALTATATPRVRDDIVANLGFRDPAVITKTFERSNLRWWAVKTSRKMTTLQRILSRTEGSGLVYAGTRRECEQLAEKMSASGLRAEAYHAGMPAEKRKAVQENWIQNRTPLVVATNAFGMGIDKADCRYVVHWAPPASLEAYYQEAGRAGRDGDLSYPILMWSPEDFDRLRRQIEQSHPDRDTLHRVYSALCDSLDLALGTMHDEGKAVEIAALALRSGLPAKQIPLVLQALEKHGTIVLAADYTPSIGIHFQAGIENISKPTGGKNAAKDRFGDQLTRIFGANALSTLYFLNEADLCEKMGLNRNALIKGLEVFRRDGYLEYEIRDGRPIIQLAEPRQPTVPISQQAVETYRNQLTEKLDKMEGYATTNACRSRYLRFYFGEDDVPETCGNCDACMQQPEASTFSAEDAESIAAILRKSPTSAEMLRKQLRWKRAKLELCLSWLGTQGLVTQCDDDPSMLQWTGK